MVTEHEGGYDRYVEEDSREVAVIALLHLSAVNPKIGWMLSNRDGIPAEQEWKFIPW